MTAMNLNLADLVTKMAFEMVAKAHTHGTGDEKELANEIALEALKITDMLAEKDMMLAHWIRPAEARIRKNAERIAKDTRDWEIRKLANAIMALAAK